MSGVNVNFHAIKLVIAYSKYILINSKRDNFDGKNIEKYSFGRRSMIFYIICRYIPIKAYMMFFLKINSKGKTTFNIVKQAKKR